MPGFLQVINRLLSREIVMYKVRPRVTIRGWGLSVLKWERRHSHSQTPRKPLDAAAADSFQSWLLPPPPTLFIPGCCRRQRLRPNLASATADSVRSRLPPTLSNPGCRHRRLCPILAAAAADSVYPGFRRRLLRPILAAAAADSVKFWLPPPPTQSNLGFRRRRLCSILAADSVQSWSPPMSLSNHGCRLSPILATAAADSVQSWLPLPPTLSNPCCRHRRLSPILAAADSVQSWLPPPPTLFS